MSIASKCAVNKFVIILVCTDKLKIKVGFNFEYIT